MGTRKSARLPARPSTRERAPAASLRSIRLSVFVAVLSIFAAACGGGATAAPAVAERFDDNTTRVAVLGESASETVPLDALQQIVARAEAAGTDLRIVVAGDGVELASAKAITDTYGGTALSYQAGRDAFQAASKDLDREQLARATDAAASETGLAASAAAFVEVLEAEGLQTTSSASTLLRWLLWALFLLALAFMVSQALAFRKARRRTRRRKLEFDQRKASLQEWVGLLGSDIEGVTASQNRLGGDGRRTLDDVRSQVNVARVAVDDASTLADLDANEIRVARAAMKVRSLRSELG